MFSSAGTSISPYTAVSTIAANTACGRFDRTPVRNNRQSPSVMEAKTRASGVRAPAMSLTADWDNPPAPCGVAGVWGHPARHGIAVAERSRKIRGTDPEEFLPWIDGVSVLLCE